MSTILETVNRFKVKCSGCDHFYQTVIIYGYQKLLHAKVDPDHLDDVILPTKECKLMHDFVRFDPCNHCCPEVFEFCPEPHSSSRGTPTEDACCE